MRLLVFGASGFIGRNFIRHWAGKSDWEIIATYHTAPQYSEFCSKLPNVKAVSAEKVFLESIADGCDGCLYLAGNSNHTEAFNNPLGDIEQSTLPLLRLLKIFKGRLVYLSSGAVYYGLKGMVSPDMAVQPTFPYAISRLANELYIKSFYERGALKDYLIIRFYHAFGPYEKPRRLVPRLIRHFLTQPDEPFPINGDGMTMMAPLYVDDVCEALGRTLQGRLGSRTLDYCAPAPISLLNFANEVANTLGVKPKWEFRETQERPIEFWSSPAEIKSIYNLKEPTPLSEGIRRYAEWIQKNLKISV